MENKLVSVVITTYKRDFCILKEAIDSVLTQTYSNLDIIIIDDNGVGTDYQVNNCNKLSLEKRIRYYSNEKNMGVQFSRNFGIFLSKGDYVAFLDDDDIWFTDKIEKQVAMFSASSLIGMVFCGGYNFYNNNIDDRDLYYNHLFFDREISFQELLNNGDYIGSTSQALIKKECFAMCGLFDCGLKSRQDYEMWLRISKNYNIVAVHEPLFLYREHNKERVSKLNSNLLNGYYGLLKKYHFEYKKAKKGKVAIYLKIANLYKSTKTLKALLIYVLCFFKKPIFTIKKTFHKISDKNWNAK